jgi:uncharacterized protein YdaU (DUF1376 family)
MRTNTSRLNATQYGAYLLLLEEETLHGPLPNNLDILCWLARLPEDGKSRVIPDLLSQFFVLGDDNLWRSDQAEAGKAKAKARRERAQKGAAARWGKRTK